MKKKQLVGLLLVFFVIGTVAGVFIALVIWNTNMSMVLIVDADELYGVHLEYEDGTPMTDYYWGFFSKGEKKVQNATVNYTGTSAGNITWNSTVPEGWSLAIWVWPYPQNPEGIYWPANGVGTVQPGTVIDIQIELTETGAIEGILYEFDLRWYTGPPW